MRRHDMGRRQGALEVPNRAEMTSVALHGKSALTFDLWRPAEIFLITRGDR